MMYRRPADVYVGLAQATQGIEARHAQFQAGDDDPYADRTQRHAEPQERGHCILLDDVSPAGRPDSARMLAHSLRNRMT